MQNLNFFYLVIWGAKVPDPSVPLKLSDNVGVCGKRAILFPY